MIKLLFDLFDLWQIFWSIAGPISLIAAGVYNKSWFETDMKLIQSEGRADFYEKCYRELMELNNGD